ncbi:MAG TPA: hypothetical protein VGB42_05500 [Candidatus Thermoplasmatota archaeon]
MGADASSLVRESVEFHRHVLEKELELCEAKLLSLEKSHGMSTEEFEAKFGRGELGDDRQWFDWLEETEAARHLRAKVESLRKLA